jgi:UDP-glucose 4-epimerase
MTYEKAKVLITGGLGFIGSNLARRLVDAGAHVTLVDSLFPQYGGNWFNISDFESRVTVEIRDVREETAMRHLIEGQDFLFNLAGQTSHIESMTDPRTDLEINAAAQLSIVESCRAVNRGIKIVFTSTRQLYGKPDHLPVDESHPIRPVDVNGINKFAGEWYHLLYNNVYSIRSSVLRLTNTYGPGMRVKDARQMFVGIWVRQLLSGQPLRVFGDGQQRRDFTYVDDCVDALLLAGESDTANGKIYNIGSAEVVTLEALAKLMVAAGYGGTYELVPFPSDRKAIDIGDYYADASLIERDLGWVPRCDLSTGMTKTLAYYARHLERYLS